jgi:hypothetical protein
MRNLWVLGLLAGLAGPTYGHFYFVLPGGEPGASAKLVIGDGPAPDPSAARDYGRPESFRAVTKSGRVAPLTVACGPRARGRTRPRCSGRSSSGW